jgi:hypothetical protein
LLSGFQRIFYACFALETIEIVRFSEFRGSGIQRIFFNEHVGRKYGTYKMVRFLEDSGFQRVRFSEFLNEFMFPITDRLVVYGALLSTQSDTEINITASG